MYQGHASETTPMVYADDPGQIILFNIYLFIYLINYLFIYLFIHSLFIADNKHNTMYAIKIAMFIIGMLIDINFQKITW